MVDTRDLKSLGHYGCVGSSPTSGTNRQAVDRQDLQPFFFFIFTSMKYNYITSGTCSRSIDFELNADGTIGDVVFTGGCHGNLQGIAALVRGMKTEDAIMRLEGIDWPGKAHHAPTSLRKRSERPRKAMRCITDYCRIS